MESKRLVVVVVLTACVGACAERALPLPSPSLYVEGASDGSADLALGPDSAPAGTDLRPVVSHDLLTPATPTNHTEPTWEPDACGNGALDPGEACDDGPRTGWSALYLAQVGRAPIPITVVRGVQPAVVFYDYHGGSSHLGSEVAGEGRLFLYRSRQEGRTALVINHGGPQQAAARVRLKLDVSFDAQLLLCDALDDDRCETYSFARFVRAHWTFADSTAGLIVGGIVEGFAMNALVYFEESSAIETWVYVDGTGDKLTLDATATLTIVGEPSTTCRADCTRP